MNHPAQHIMEPPPTQMSLPIADLAHQQVPGTQILVWAARNAQIMLNLNQALFGIGLNMLEHQQEVIGTVMQSLLLPARDQASAGNDRIRAFAEPPASAAPREGC